MRLDRNTTIAGKAIAGAALAVALTGGAQAAERVSVGDPAPAFTLPATDGTDHQLAALHGETSAVLVFFRGAW